MCAKLAMRITEGPQSVPSRTWVAFPGTCARLAQEILEGPGGTWAASSGTRARLAQRASGETQQCPQAQVPGYPRGSQPAPVPSPVPSPGSLEQILVEGGGGGEGAEAGGQQQPAPLLVVDVGVTPDLVGGLCQELVPQPWC